VTEASHAVKEICPLCHSGDPAQFTESHKRIFYHCPSCDLRFVARRFKLSPEDEKKRYDLHRNDIHDVGYQKFIQPIVDGVRDFYPKSAKGLDYGCGPSSVATHLLSGLGYEVEIYDPHFFPKSKSLDRTYDFIVCSEVAEHFDRPNLDFQQLKNLMGKKSHLFLMTLLWTEDVCWAEWAYARDTTHLSFYSRRTFEWIREQIGFEGLKFRGDRIIILN